MYCKQLLCMWLWVNVPFLRLQLHLDFCHQRRCQTCCPHLLEQWHIPPLHCCQHPDHGLESDPQLSQLTPTLAPADGKYLEEWERPGTGKVQFKKDQIEPFRSSILKKKTNQRLIHPSNQSINHSDIHSETFLLFAKRGGLSLTSLRVMLMVVVEASPPSWPPMSLAWRRTWYSPFTSRSMFDRAVRMTPRGGKVLKGSSFCYLVDRQPQKIVNLTFL